VRCCDGLSSRTSRSKSKASRTQPPQAKDGSQPAVQISYTAAGQETLAAIAEELLTGMPQASHDNADEAPEISVAESPAGRATLALMAEEVRPVRAEQTTLSYSDRISNAPGARTPSRAPEPMRGLARTPSRSSAPEISVGEGPVGRETLAVITAELVPSMPEMQAKAAPTTEPVAARSARDESAHAAPFAIFEMLTFVVQGPETASLSSETVRRRFVEDHLLRRLPAKSMAQVDRVDVTPWTVRGTVVVRVWCKV
jgi:hypothetical protein